MTKSKIYPWLVAVAWIIFVVAACSLHEEKPVELVGAVVHVEPSQRPAKILRVIDGDTVECCIELASKTELGSVFSITTSCRLFGINAPDTHPDGQEKTLASTKNLISLILKNCPGDSFGAELKGRDKYGRVLIIIWANGTNLNHQQVSSGHAVDYYP
jgi:endonuclease YncB( thermonuclease family)